MDGIAVRGASGSGDQPLVAAAAVLGLLRRAPDLHEVRVAIDRLGELKGPQQVDRFLAAVAGARGLGKNALAPFARWLCEQGTRREVVKPAIALLGISGDPADRDLIVTLGLLEELTLYSLVALTNLLPESEEALFDLAQQVENWGRVHAVRRLNGSTSPPVKAWLLRGGAENGVMIEEVAFIAATTGDLRAALEDDVDDELLDHAGELLWALALGGPAEDMSDYNDGAAALSAYLRHADAYVPTSLRLRHLVTLERYLNGWAEKNPRMSAETRESLADSLRSILDRPEWASLVAECLASEDLRIVKAVVARADRFGIDPTPTVRQWLPRSPLDAYLWQWLVKKSTADEYRELLREANTLLPIEALDTGPADHLGIGTDCAREQCFEILIRRLDELPGEGWTLLRIAFNNRVTRVRGVAALVLESWPIDAWPPDAEALLTATLWREPNEKLRTRLRALVNASPKA